MQKLTTLLEALGFKEEATWTFYQVKDVNTEFSKNDDCVLIFQWNSNSQVSTKLQCKTKSNPTQQSLIHPGAWHQWTWTGNKENCELFINRISIQLAAADGVGV